jgi:transaldolase
MTNPLRELAEAGQAPWLDYVHRKILEDGELQRLIDEDGVTGLTSNPSIFEKAIGEGDAYDDKIQALARPGESVERLYERIAIEDIQAAADILRPTYDRLDSRDGYVSLEVTPAAAMDTERTLTDARRLWTEVGRPNLMIKVPGTSAGTPAIRTLIGEGININVTLLFGVEAYLDVAEAFMAGLEAFKARGGDISRVHSVASFFVSRIDTKIDSEIDARLKAGATGQEAERLSRLRGRIAIANAKRAYQRYLELIDGPRWKPLAEAGASPQRLLWASTGVKDPKYVDTLYVQSLIGRDTVDTMPPKTMDAFRDHGHAAETLTADVPLAEHDLAEAQGLGLDLDRVTHDLVIDGVKQFADAFDALQKAVGEKRERIAAAA